MANVFVIVIAAVVAAVAASFTHGEIVNRHALYNNYNSVK